MRIVENLFAVWSDSLKRYVIVSVNGREHTGPVALAFSGGGGGGTEVIPTGPFGPQIPFIISLFEQAANLYNQGPPQFPGFNTVAQPGQDLLQSQTGIAEAVEGNVDTSQTAVDTALSSALSAGQNPVLSSIASLLGPNRGPNAPPVVPNAPGVPSKPAPPGGFPPPPPPTGGGGADDFQAGLLQLLQGGNNALVQQGVQTQPEFLRLKMTHYLLGVI